MNLSIMGSSAQPVPFVLHVKPISTQMINLDYYDQLCLNEQYSEDTLFAFGSEEYLNPHVSDSSYTQMDQLLDSITTHAMDYF